MAEAKRVRSVLGLFVKAPVPGRVKTRLCPPLAPVEAAALYAAFVEDAIERLGPFASARGIGLEVVHAGGGTALVPWRRVGLRLRPQRGDGLFVRMSRYFADVFGEGVRAAAILGSDVPTLPLERIESAFAAIERGMDGAIAPDDGGGYCLIALARPAPRLFEDLPAGSDRIFEATRERAVAAGVRLAALPGWYDVDHPADLVRLRDELARSPRALAPRTRAILATLPLPPEATAP